MDASERGVHLNKLADLMERDRIYLAVSSATQSDFCDKQAALFLLVEFGNTGQW